MLSSDAGKYISDHLNVALRHRPAAHRVLLKMLPAFAKNTREAEDRRGKHYEELLAASVRLAEEISATPGNSAPLQPKQTTVSKLAACTVNALESGRANSSPARLASSVHAVIAALNTENLSENKLPLLAYALPDRQLFVSGRVTLPDVVKALERAHESLVYTQPGLRSTLYGTHAYDPLPYYHDGPFLQRLAPGIGVGGRSRRVSMIDSPERKKRSNTGFGCGQIPAFP